MRIAYLSSACIPSRTANSIHVMKMSQAFSRAGHDVRLIAPDKQAGQEQSAGDTWRYYGVEPCFEMACGPCVSMKGRGYWYGWQAARMALRWGADIATNNRDLLPLSPVADAHYVPNGMSAEAEPFQWPRPYVAWVANIKPAKRPELFVEAARALAEHGIDALMVGHIQSRGYHWLTDPDSVPPNFHYLGPRSTTEVNGLLAASRLHVHTCQPEGFPNVFIQAWMQGRPSISLDFDPCSYIKDQGLGEVSDGDITTFIDQVIEWATDPARCDAIGNQAKIFAEATFSVDKMVERVEKILKEVISK